MKILFKNIVAISFLVCGVYSISLFSSETNPIISVVPSAHLTMSFCHPDNPFKTVPFRGPLGLKLPDGMKLPVLALPLKPRECVITIPVKIVRKALDDMKDEEDKRKQQEKKKAREKKKKEVKITNKMLKNGYGFDSAGNAVNAFDKPVDKLGFVVQEVIDGKRERRLTQRFEPVRKNKSTKTTKK
jgi:hypothetical protein